MMDNNQNIMNTYGRKELVFNEGIGAYLFDGDDKYLDFVSGVAVNILGHSSPIIVETIKEQAEKLLHVSNLYYTENLISLSKKLCSLCSMKSVFFCNSGTEAVEGALKISKKYGKINNKSKIIYMNNSFHGRSLGALSITGQTKYQEDFYPLLSNVISIDYNDTENLIAELDDTVAAVFIEVIQGEGGIVEIDTTFANTLSKLTKDFGALLVVDEIQSGIYRTGKVFAYEHYGIEPDVICAAKGLGGGLPIGAVIVNDKADVLLPGDHGSTFGGNPFVTSVALKILNYFDASYPIEHLNTKSEQIKVYIESLMPAYPFITKVKGKGLLLGIDIEGDTKALIDIACKYKLLLVGAGKSTVRLLPPLNLSDKELEDFKIKFNDIVKEFSKYIK